ncbi:hypothetical protein CQW23_12173 [Capsicum baccatum]|uniref:phosphoglycerate kinase n=1 Tax=Capsicum baccatum TaxID=33114 RepID=A0A2G2WRU3_CAPBA|nr:hypothetical protein CQW23_12173 [Capsicum baccatum]
MSHSKLSRLRVQGQHSNNRRYNNKSQGYKPNNPNFKKRKGTCFTCEKPGHYAAQCRHRIRTNKEIRNPPKDNLVEEDKIIVAVISQVNIVAHIKEWAVDSRTTRHICTNREAFASYTSIGDDREVIYLGDSRTAKVLGKGKVLLKKTLALMDVPHIPTMRANLISVALLDKAGMKVSVESNKIILWEKTIVYVVDDSVKFKEAVKHGNLIPRYRSIFSDHLTPVLAYCYLVKEDDRESPSFLFDVIEAQPIMEIVAKENMVTIVDHFEGSRTEEFLEDPMINPHKIMEKWKPQCIDELPEAFCGVKKSARTTEEIEKQFGCKSSRLIMESLFTIVLANCCYCTVSKLQIRASRRSLGEQDASENSKAIGISRPRFVDQHVRQQRALQQLGMMQQHAWRPQRGLPETFVLVLRAWLSEYFLHSGVSGSGKTKTAKFAIGYLVMISGGNNKERLTEIYFSAEGGIAVLTNKHSRVVQLARGERFCHIFYQLCPGAPSALRDKLKLKGASEYNFLNQTESLVIHNVDDAKKFHMLVKALNTLGISERDQEYAFQMVVALLWLGNITFQAIGNRNNVEVVQSEGFLIRNLYYCLCEQENIPLEEVFQNLRCNIEGGLTSQDAQVRLEIFGYNKLEEKHELDYLVGAVSTKRPFTAIVGGSKVSSKIGVIESLLEKCDILLLGGGMILTFYKAQGLSVETRTLAEVHEVLEYASQTKTSLTRIMLDNRVIPLSNGDVEVSMLKEAVDLIDGSDALTHSVKALDISLKIDTELALEVGRHTKGA